MLDEERNQLRDWATVHAVQGVVQARLVLRLLEEEKRLRAIVVEYERRIIAAGQAV